MKQFAGHFILLAITTAAFLVIGGLALPKFGDVEHVHIQARFIDDASLAGSSPKLYRRVFRPQDGRKERGEKVAVSSQNTSPSQAARTREGQLTAEAAKLQFRARRISQQSTTQVKAYQARHKMALALARNYPKSAAVILTGINHAEGTARALETSASTTSKVADRLVKAHGTDTRTKDDFHELQALRFQTSSLQSVAARARAKVGADVRLLSAADTLERLVKHAGWNARYDTLAGDLVFGPPLIS